MKKLSDQPNGDQISKHIQDALNKREYDNAFGVSLIPYHEHTGTDSPKISYNDLTDLPTSTVAAPTKIEFPWMVRFAGNVNSTPAINSDWTRAFFYFANAGQGMVLENKSGTDNKDGMWVFASFPSLTPTARSQVTYHSGVDKFFIGVIGGSVYVYNDDSAFSGETVCTFSGYTLGTKCQGLASDGTYLYMFDNSTSQVVTFTVSGSVLTYVSTSATLAIGSTSIYLTSVDATNWYLYNFTGTYNGSTSYIADRTTGANTLTQVLSGTDGLLIDPDGQLRVAQRQYTGVSAVTSPPYGYGLYKIKLL